jgi:hypothetical protein
MHAAYHPASPAALRAQNKQHAMQQTSMFSVVLNAMQCNPCYTWLLAPAHAIALLQPRDVQCALPIMQQAQQQCVLFTPNKLHAVQHTSSICAALNAMHLRLR